jgi:HD-GYP domain-containing protein (c-di-GMP phosphodiesterase class II)
MAPPPALKTSAATPADVAGTPLERIYDELLVFVRQLFEQARAGQPLDLSAAVPLLQRLPALDQGMVELVSGLINRHTEENYLYSHSVNVALLASYLAQRLNHAPQVAQQLALAGLLHDIGMAGAAEQLAASPRKLTKEEWKVMAKHPEASLERLQHAAVLTPEARQAIVSHHEREQGRGYPTGEPQAATLNEFGKILAVCDVYDAVTHPRSYRRRQNPAQGIKLLIEGAGTQYDHRVVRALIGELSLYPPGSMIKLNTNEIGLVERINFDAPLRPVVVIHYDAEGHALSSPRRVDLIHQPFSYVKEVVTDKEPVA